jgi:hypothetical protein
MRPCPRNGMPTYTSWVTEISKGLAPIQQDSHVLSWPEMLQQPDLTLSRFKVHLIFCIQVETSIKWPSCTSWVLERSLTDLHMDSKVVLMKSTHNAHKISQINKHTLECHLCLINKTVKGCLHGHSVCLLMEGQWISRQDSISYLKSLLKVNWCFGGACRVHFRGWRVNQAIKQHDASRSSQDGEKHCPSFAFEPVNE